MRAAVLDLYNGYPNQGMRCILELLSGVAETTVFDVRGKSEVPDLSYDVYISSGGPGSPYEGLGTDWEEAYFGWVRDIWAHNQLKTAVPKRVLAICHSFELICRHFSVARVTLRHSPSFGITPIHKTETGAADPLFAGLEDPFLAADFREWQVVQPDAGRLAVMGAEVIALEKVRPHVPRERAVTAIRFSPEIVGLQFHPEAEPGAMAALFRGEKREATIKAHGERKWQEIVERIEDPQGLAPTYRTIIPRFLEQARGAPAAPGGQPGYLAET